MAVIVLLANGALQQLIQPLAYGAALGLHPLAVLIVTIAGGALFGTIGLILGAPLTAAALHVSTDAARARAREAADPPATNEDQSAPSGQRPDLDAHPVLRVAVRERPARGIGRDDRHGDADFVEAALAGCGGASALVLGRRAEQDLVDGAVGHERRDRHRGVVAIGEQLDGSVARRAPDEPERFVRRPVRCIGVSLGGTISLKSQPLCAAARPPRASAASTR